MRAWLESEKYRNLERSCAEIEAVLGVKLAELRDELIGDAVVLVLRLDPDALPDPRQARGLLLLRARDPGLLERLIAGSTASQRESGELERVERPTRAETTYHVREFPAGAGRPPEWYVSYPDGTFAFSNSEAMIQGVIDRKARLRQRAGPVASGRDGRTRPGRPAEVQGRATPTAGAGAGPTLRRPASDRAAAGRRAAVGQASDVRIIAMLERYLAAVEYAGAALTWGRMRSSSTRSRRSIPPGSTPGSADGPATRGRRTRGATRPADGPGPGLGAR